MYLEQIKTLGQGKVYDLNSPDSEYEIKEEPSRFDYGLGKGGKELQVFGLYYKPTGKRVGQHIYYSQYKPKESKQRGTSVYTHHTQSIEVNLEHRGKGLANAMYVYAEESGPYDRMVPTKNRTKGGKALWSQPNRPFGVTEGARGDTDKEEINKGTRQLPSELIAGFAMNLFEKEIKEKVDSIIKNSDNVINLGRGSNPPVDSI